MVKLAFVFMALLLFVYFIFLKEAEDLHWKVSRTRMWMNWVNKGSVLPPPYNLIPNPKAVIHLFTKIMDKCRGFNQVGCSLHGRLRQKRKLTRSGGGRVRGGGVGVVKGVGAGRLGERMVKQRKRELTLPTPSTSFMLSTPTLRLKLKPG